MCLLVCVVGGLYVCAFACADVWPCVVLWLAVCLFVRCVIACSLSGCEFVFMIGFAACMCARLCVCYCVIAYVCDYLCVWLCECLICAVCVCA